MNAAPARTLPPVPAPAADQSAIDQPSIPKPRDNDVDLHCPTTHDGRHT